MLVMVSLISSRRLQRGGADLTMVKLNRLIDPNWKATQPTANGKLLHGSADVWFKAFFPPATACRAGH